MIHHARGPKSFADAVSRVPVCCSRLSHRGVTLGFQSPFLEQRLPQPVILSVEDAAVVGCSRWAPIRIYISAIHEGKRKTVSLRDCFVVVFV